MGLMASVPRMPAVFAASPFVGATPDGGAAIVALDAAPGAVKIVSLSTRTVTATVTVDDYPHYVAITPDGTKAVVTHNHAISIIALPSNAVTSMPVPCVGDTLYDIATTPDSASAVTTMLSASCTSNTLGIVSLAGSTTGSITSTFPLSQVSAGLGALTQDGADALLSLGVLGTSILRVSLSSGSVTPIANTSASYGIAVVPPSGAEALVASGDSDTVKRVSLSSNSVIGFIDYAANADSHNIAVAPSGAHAVAAGSFDVGLLSLAGAGSVVCKWSGGGRSVAITPDGARALVTLSDKLRIFGLP